MPLSMANIATGQQHAVTPKYPNKSLMAGTLTLVFTVRDKKSGKAIKEHRLICMPTAYEASTESRSQMYYTKDGIYVDMPQKTGIGATYFTISGHTLYRGITQAGQQSTLQTALQLISSAFSSSGSSSGTTTTSSIDGAAAIKDLEDTIRWYFFPEAGTQSGNENASSHAPGDLQLEFLNLNAPTSSEDSTGQLGWIIHPHRGLVTVRQDAQHPFLWNYQFQFAGIELMKEAVFPDGFSQSYSDTQSLIENVQERLDNLVAGIETLQGAIDEIVREVTTPVSDFVNSVSQLSEAVQNFISSITDKIEYPLYVAQSLRNSGTGISSTAQQSVESIKYTAEAFQNMLTPGTQGSSQSGDNAGTSLTAGTNDQLTFSVNGESEQTVDLGTQDSGESIASAIQTAIRSSTAESTSNAAGYTDATCTYDADSGQYTLTSGTQGSAAASISVHSPETMALTSNDAAIVLKLGTTNGGLESQGSSEALGAISLLRDVSIACTRLLATPEHFATTLQDDLTTLRQQQLVHVTGEQFIGEQYVTWVRILYGDTLRSIAARHGIAWEAIAAANHLQYPYIIDGPSTLTTGVVSVSGEIQALTDTTQNWPLEQFQGQRVDLIRNNGAGQSRNVLSNTGTRLLIDRPWDVLPTSDTVYAIREGGNPIIQTGFITAVDANTLTDNSLTLIPESQRGYEIRILDKHGASQTRRIAEHTTMRYMLREPWDVVPTIGAKYAIILPQAPVRRTALLVGDPIAIPRPPTRQRLGRPQLIDLSSITGKQSSQEDLLFQTDIFLQNGEISLYAPTQDFARVSGLKNVRQAVLHLLNLTLGELEYAPSLGSYLQEHLGRMATLSGELELIHSIERSIRQDARIARIGSAQLVARGGAVEILFDAMTVTGETLDRVAIR